MDLLIKFTDTSNSFAAGVELGRILQQMQDGKESVSNGSFPVRIENMEVLKSCAIAYGYTYCFTSVYFGEWIEFIAIKKSLSDN